MKMLILSAAVLALTTSGCTATKEIPMTERKQIVSKITSRITMDVSTQYLLYLPEGYGQKKEWPLLLFLHGAGERGSNIEIVKRHGPPKLVEQGKHFPFILVSPQCPEDETWSVRTLGALIENLRSKYNVDPARIYVTGLSMGGFGTWKLAIAYPNQFAAIAPICGGGDSSSVCVLKDTPTWVFHGKQDRVVPIERSESLVRALKSCGGNVKFTVYPDAGHDSWTETYNNSQFFDWLLSQKLTER